MRNVLTGIILLAFAPMAAAQDVPRTITVEARGHVMVEPELFALHLIVEAEADTALEAIRQNDEIVRRPISDLPRLEGLDRVEVTTGEFELGRMCVDSSRYSPRRPCDERGHLARQTVLVEAGPANRAGDAASFAREIGAATADVSTYRLQNAENARRQAFTNAVEQARFNAQGIAAALGGTLGAVRQVRPVEDFGARYRVAASDVAPLEAIGTGVTRVRADQPMAVEPGPIRIEERLIITFDLAPPEQPRRR